ncbi:hypothetical protein [Kaistella palustris]|nr:hypothetical protein [Kaistella palustris]
MKRILLFIFFLTAVVHYSQSVDSPVDETDKTAYYKPGETKLHREF